MLTRSACSHLSSALILAIALTAGLSMPACNGLSKQPGALDSKGGDFSELVQNCEKAQTFKLTVQPIFQSRCASCHQTGGAGAGKLQLNNGTALTDNQIGQNYFASVSHLLPDDGGDYTLNPIVLYPAGNNHISAMPVTEDDYTTVLTWIQTQRDSSIACDGLPAN
ncbi:MAG: hypothetical protein H7222_11325 [Methylotenera sp.]|nr:hypothetical protein [Oligoflexia bacterium]